jgi:hypothetical protein
VTAEFVKARRGQYDDLEIGASFLRSGGQVHQSQARRRSIIVNP